MTEKKYEKYIITDVKEMAAPSSKNDSGKEKDNFGTRLLWLDGNVIKESSFFVESAWYWPRSKPVEVVEEAHAHPFEEVISFFGTNPDDPKDLCGEIEFWLGDEQYILTKSCIVFVPKGIKLCPLIIRKVKRPIFHFIAGPAGKYT
jgi:hypothetical protein